MRTLSLTASLALVLFACNGDKSDSGTTDGTDGADGADGAADGADGGTADGADGAGDGADGTEATTFNIEGTAVNFDNPGAPAAEGLCVEILDPTNVLTGGDPVVVSETTVGPGGAYTATDVPVVSLGLFAQFRDCDGDASTVFPSANGISSGTYSDVADGDTVSGLTHLVLSNPVAEGVQGSLTAAGYTGDIVADGMIIGFLWDNARQPIDGAIMTCGSCTVYYADGDPSDGLFTTGGAVNTGTAVAGGGMFAVPSAQLTTYAPEAAGYTFSSSPLAALPAAAVVVAFTAE